MRKIYNAFRFVVFFLFISTQTHAATYYVSANGGSDSNPGTQAAPFRTIAKGSQAMASGDTLYIRAGTYNEAMIHGYDGFKFLNGTPSAYTRYAAAPGDEGKVIVKAPPGNFVAWFSRSLSYIELSDMTLDGTNTTSYVVKLDGSYTQDTFAHHIRLLRNELRFGRMGIGGGRRSEIIGNRIHHMKAYGMYVGGGGNSLIEGNIIHDNDGFGLHLFEQHHPVNGWVVRNNIFYNNGGNYRPSYRGGALRPLPGVILTRGKNEFYNNLVYNNPYGGISVYGNGDDTLVANNTIYGNGKYGIGVADTIDKARIINNIVWGNTGAQITDNGRGTVIQNNLTTDPKFVNPAAGDFGVQASSPAIDKGATLAEVKTDFTGKVRPEGTAYDIGAFEGAGSRADAMPDMSGGLPAGAGGGFRSDPLGLGNCIQY